MHENIFFLIGRVTAVEGYKVRNGISVNRDWANTKKCIEDFNKAVQKKLYKSFGHPVED